MRREEGEVVGEEETQPLLEVIKMNVVRGIATSLRQLVHFDDVCIASTKNSSIDGQTDTLVAHVTQTE